MALIHRIGNFFILAGLIVLLIFAASMLDGSGNYDLTALLVGATLLGLGVYWRRSKATAPPPMPPTPPPAPAKARPPKRGKGGGKSPAPAGSATGPPPKKPGPVRALLRGPAPKKPAGGAPPAKGLAGPPGKKAK